MSYEDDPNPIANIDAYTIRTAASVGDVDTVRWFLRRHKPYVDEYLESDGYDDDEGEYKHVDIMDLRSDPNAKDPISKQTSLHLSCLFGHPEITKVLLNQPLNALYIKDSQGHLPIHLATPECLSVIIEYFQEQEAKLKIQNERKRDASKEGFGGLESDALVYTAADLYNMLEIKDGNGRSVIMGYCLENQFKQLKTVIDTFPDYFGSAYFDRKDCYGLYSLTLAIISENKDDAKETIDVLISSGANPNLVNSQTDGYTPLMYAIKCHKDVSVAERILEALSDEDVDKYTTKSNNFTPFLLAAWFNRIDVIDCMCSMKASGLLRFNKDACSKNGLNAICLAILRGHKECVDALIKCGVQLWTRGTQHHLLEKLLEIPAPIILSNHLHRTLADKELSEQDEMDGDDIQTEEKKANGAEEVKRNKWGMKVRETNDFSSSALRKHIPAQQLNRMVQGAPTSKSLQLVTDIIIDYNKLDLFLFPPPPIEDADLTLKDIDFKHEIKYLYNELVDMPEKAANDDILAHTLEKHFGQELSYLKSLYEKYALDWPEKFHNVELREKGEDVIAKPLTKKQKRKKREAMLKSMERLGESYEERLALSLKAFLLGHGETLLGDQEGDSSDEDESKKKKKKKKKRKKKKRKPGKSSLSPSRKGKSRRRGRSKSPKSRRRRKYRSFSPRKRSKSKRNKKFKGEKLLIEHEKAVGGDANVAKQKLLQIGSDNNVVEEAGLSIVDDESSTLDGGSSWIDVVVNDETDVYSNTKSKK